MTIGSQSGWRLNEDIKMSHPVSCKFGAIKNYYFTVLDLFNFQKVPKIDFTAKHGMGCSEIRA